MGTSAVAFSGTVYHGEWVTKKGENEVWTMNYGYQVWQHDVLFNIRDLAWERMHNPAGDFIEAYREHPVPVVTTRWISDIKNCFEFPFEELFAYFGDQYFSCSNAYIVAFAIMCLEKDWDKSDKSQVRELNLYGLDFNAPGRTEYEAGRACVEYWVGRAIERGIVVNVPPVSTLLDHYYRIHGRGAQDNGALYGFHDLKPEFDYSGPKLKLVGWKDDSG